MDKRIIKTRTAIFNAVFDLSTEKELDKITVIELCQKAGINKSTFYLHYNSIDDCFKKCFDFFTDRVLALSSNIDYTEVAVSPEATVDKMLDVVEKNMDFIMKFKTSVVYDSSIRMIKEKFVKSICEVNNLNMEDNYHQIVKITLMVGGCLDAMTQYLPKFDKKELHNIMVDVIKRRPQL